MSSQWVAYVALIGVLLAAASAAIDAGLRAARRPTRWLWAVAIAAVLAFAAGSLQLAPAARPAANAVTVASVPAAAASPAAEARPTVLERVRIQSAALIAGAIARSAALLPASVGRRFGAVWAASSLFVLVMIAGVQLRMAIVRRRWPTADLHGTRVRLSPNTGPAVIGLARPDIVVPRWLLSRDVTEQRVAVQHEAEHLRVHDHLLLAGATLLVAAIPWHPAAWWMLARLRLAMELDCDARILRAGVAPRQYGEMLIDLAGACAGVRFGAVALADKRSHLERRLLAMTPNTTKSARGRIVLGLCAGVLALAAACEARVPTSSEIQAMDVSGAERALAKTPMMPFTDTSKVTFYVDGVLKTAAQAHAVTANSIRSISVDHTGGAGKTVVRVSTAGTLDTASISTGDALLKLHNQVYNSLKSLHGKVAEVVRRDSAKYSISGGPVAFHGDSITFEGHATVMKNMDSFGGVVYVDGVLANNSALDTLDPNRIAKVEIVKATASEPRGHISVTTRK